MLNKTAPNHIHAFPYEYVEILKAEIKKLKNIIAAIPELYPIAECAERATELKDIYLSHCYEINIELQCMKGQYITASSEYQGSFDRGKRLSSEISTCEKAISELMWDINRMWQTSYPVTTLAGNENERREYDSNRNY